MLCTNAHYIHVHYFKVYFVKAFLIKFIVAHKIIWTHFPPKYVSAASREIRSASPTCILYIQSRTLSPMTQLRSGFRFLAENAIIMSSHFCISNMSSTHQRTCFSGQVLSVIRRWRCSSPTQYYSSRALETLVKIFFSPTLDIIWKYQTRI